MPEPQLSAHEDIPASEGQGDIEEGSWIAAEYEGHWYIGKVLKLEESEVFVDFLEKALSMHTTNIYKFPTREDQLWVLRVNIIKAIPKEPTPHGKSQRLLKFTSDTLNTIQDT